MEMTKAGVLAVFSSNNETEFDRLHRNKSGRYAAMKVRRAGNFGTEPGRRTCQRHRRSMDPGDMRELTSGGEIRGLAEASFSLSSWIGTTNSTFRLP
jgi:hypothetical protein